MNKKVGHTPVNTSPHGVRCEANLRGADAPFICQAQMEQMADACGVSVKYCKIGSC